MYHNVCLQLYVSLPVVQNCLKSLVMSDCIYPLSNVPLTPQHTGT